MRISGVLIAWRPDTQSPVLSMPIQITSVPGIALGMVSNRTHSALYVCLDI